MSGFKCPECRCMAFSIVQEPAPSGRGFRDSNMIRCHGCKLELVVSLPSEVAALTAAAEMRGREDALEAARAVHTFENDGDEDVVDGPTQDEIVNAIASLPPPSGASALAAMLDQARQQEREACAAIADRFQSRGHEGYDGAFCGGNCGQCG